MNELAEPPERRLVNLLLSCIAACSVKPFYEVFSEEYPTPVCNACSVPMLARTEIIRIEDGHKEVRCGFQCSHCRAVLPVRSERRSARFRRQETFPFAG